MAITKVIFKLTKKEIIKTKAKRCKTSVRHWKRVPGKTVENKVPMAKKPSEVFVS